MAILTPTDITGIVVWLGRVTDRDETICSESCPSLVLDFAGIEGEAHRGLTRPSCSRVAKQYPKGTEIRNSRQVTLVSQEDLAAIAAAMDLPEIRPDWLGTNIVLTGIPDFTLVPAGSRLVFETGTSLTVDIENAPCQLPARVIERLHPRRGKAFKTAAQQRRGVTAWVERPGGIALGDTLRLHVPPQRPYPHLP